MIAHVGWKLRPPLDSHLFGRHPCCSRKSVTFMVKTLRIHASRKNANSSRTQAPKGRAVDAPKKIGAVGVPVKSSPTRPGKFGSGDGMLRGNQARGQVIAAQANFVRVLLEKVATVKPSKEESGASTIDGSQVASGNEEFHEDLVLLCVVRTLLKKINRRVLVGDRVVVTGIDWIAKRGMVEDVFDRSSEISDPPLANVDHLLVVFSMDRPKLDYKVLSRFLVEVESTEIPFTLILNKADLVKPEVIEQWQGRLGPSGVGKSSLINVLRDEKGVNLWNGHDETNLGDCQYSENGSTHQDIEEAELFEDLKVGDVSVASGRGRHTTRNVSLVRLPAGNGLLADSPGFSQPNLAQVSSSCLAQLYPEIGVRLAASELGRCGFLNCLHVGEPSCVVGSDWERYSHYLELLEEVRNRERVEKRVLGTKRDSEVRYKTGTEGIQQAEPKLVMKKHRRESRKQVRQSLEHELWDQQEVEVEMETEKQEDN